VKQRGGQQRQLSARTAFPIPAINKKNLLLARASTIKGQM
jgi:hypothetical protein